MRLKNRPRMVIMGLSTSENQFPGIDTTTLEVVARRLKFMKARIPRSTVADAPVRVWDSC